MCRLQERGEQTVRLQTVLRELGDDILEGALVCDHPSCRREHPILDGIPVLVSNLNAWAQHQLDAVLRRTDLTPWMTSLLADAAGSGTVWDDERRTTSTYAYAHYDDGATYLELSRAAFRLAPPPKGGVVLDLGSACGRGTFELAAHAELAVGIDLSYAMLIVGERARRTGRVAWAERDIGLVYQPREVAAPAHRERVAFLCGDVCNVPLRGAATSYAMSINVIDCVSEPVVHASELARLVGSGGDVVISTPYDWTQFATPSLANWIGGHSQRGDFAGSPEKTLSTLLPRLDLEPVGEQRRVPWRLRVSDRSTMEYAVHVTHARRR